MPAKTVIFNSKAQTVHSFALAPRNTVLFSPHGRFVLVAGFGNLAGQMDIYDLEKDFAKICTIEASNASVCEWSPDGQHILTATLSPRLRVDNGIRIWHAGGPLVYNEDMNELYHVCWRPQPTSVYPLPDNPFSPMPTPHASATQYLGTKKTPSKPAGAYRPPGARGTSTPLAFKREDEGGAAFVREGVSSYASNVNGFGKGRAKAVPGAEPVEDRKPLPPGAAPGGGVSLTGTGEAPDEQLSKAAKKNAKKREAKKAAAAAAKEQGSTTLVPDAAPAGAQTKSPSRSPTRGAQGQAGGHQRSRSRGYVPAAPPGLEAPQNRRERSRSDSKRQDRNAPRTNGTPKGPAVATATATPKPTKVAPGNITTTHTPPPVPAPEIDITSPLTPGGDPRDKKIRGLLKKIRAIDDLKMRLAGGETLEDTQHRKMGSEAQIRGELAALGFTDAA